MSAQNKSSKIHSVGQLLIVGFDGTEMTRRRASLLTKLQPAGVILFARNITGAEQTWRLLEDCQKCVTTRLFACVDLEGGRVDRFRDVLGPAPAAPDVFAVGVRCPQASAVPARGAAPAPLICRTRLRLTRLVE